MNQELIGGLLVHGVLGALLILYTIQDIRYRKIQVCYAGFAIPIIVTGIIMGGNYDITYRLLGLATGVILYFISIISKEQIGKGDALVLSVTGVGLGFWNNLGLLFMGLLCASGYCIVKMIKSKFGRKETIPMIPFLLCGYCLLLIIL